MFLKKIQDCDRHMLQAQQQLRLEAEAHSAAAAEFDRRVAAIEDIPDAGERYTQRLELEREQAVLAEQGQKLSARSDEITAFWEERVRLEDEQLAAYPKQTEPSPN